MTMLCVGYIHDTDRPAAEFRVDQHGCWTGCVCQDCLSAARAFFTLADSRQFACAVCRTVFTSFTEAFPKVVPL